MRKSSYVKPLIVFTVLLLCSCTCTAQPNIKLIIVQDIQATHPDQPLGLIHIASASGANDFLSLDDIAEVHLYSRTNVNELLESMSFGNNETADKFKLSMKGLAGSRYYKKEEKEDDGYVAVVSDSFEVNDSMFKGHDYALLVESDCQLPSRYPYRSVAEIREEWTIKHLAEGTSYSIDLPKVRLQTTRMKSYRTAYLQQVRDYITNSKLGTDFVEVMTNKQ